MNIVCLYVCVCVYVFTCTYMCVYCWTSKYYTKTWGGAFISCWSKFLSRKRACSKLCSNTPTLTSIPIISLLICERAFFILTSGAAVNNRNRSVMTWNKTILKHAYFPNMHVLCNFAYSIDLYVHLLLIQIYFSTQMTIFDTVRLEDTWFSRIIRTWRNLSVKLLMELICFAYIIYCYIAIKITNNQK